MPKVRANVTVDSHLWERVREFFIQNPQMGSISALFELTLTQYMEVMPELVAKANAGDGRAALAVLQRSHNVYSSEISLGLNDLELAVTHHSLVPDSLKSKEVSTSRKSKKSV